MPRIAPALVFLAVLLTAFLIYRPGLTGPFLLDDQPNLQALANSRGADLGADILAFLASGRSGPTGRPLSLLSFFIDDYAWPSDPDQFKYTNLLLHLLNGALITWLALRLALVARAPNQRATLIAITVGTLWLLHPLNVSTVLYVIQRMTILSTMFMLVGLLAYTYGRQILYRRPTAGFVWIATGLIGGTTLAVLSKENGILLPVYALVIEMFLFQPREIGVPPRWRRARIALLLVPSGALTAYLLFKTLDPASGYSGRPFSLSERLLTQSRVLWDYAGQIVVPRIQGTGLFHDDYVISRSLFDPISTIIAVGLWALVVTAAVHLSQRLPLLVFGVLWFLGGHLLESTSLPLELYFEHRNYLPMFGFLFAASFALSNYMTTRMGAVTGALLAASLATALATITWSQAKVWSSPYTLAAVWSVEKPESPRAQQMAANLWLAQGDYQRAKQGVLAATQSQHGNPGLMLQLMQLGCLEGSVTQTDVASSANAIRFHVSRDFSADTTLVTTIPKLYRLASHCGPLDTEAVDDLIALILENPNFGATLKSSMYYLKGKQFAGRRQLDPAVRMLDLAYDLQPSVDVALLQSYWLATAGLKDDAFVYVDKASRLDGAGRWPYRNLRRNDIISLRERIERMQ